MKTSFFRFVLPGVATLAALHGQPASGNSGSGPTTAVKRQWRSAAAQGRIEVMHVELECIDSASLAGAPNGSEFRLPPGAPVSLSLTLRNVVLGPGGGSTIVTVLAG